MDFLVALIQFIGTAVTVAGLIVAAPRTAGRVVADAGRFVKRSRERLLRWLRIRPREVNRGVLNAQLSGPPTATWHGRPVRQPIKGTLKTRLTYLEQWTAELSDDLRRHEQATHHALRDLRAQLNDLSANHSQLRVQIELESAEQETLNHRGFPLAALGALLAGIPGAWLAAAGWCAVTLVLMIGGGAALHAGAAIWQSRGELWKGARAYSPAPSGSLDAGPL